MVLNSLATCWSARMASLTAMLATMRGTMSQIRATATRMVIGTGRISRHIRLPRSEGREDDKGLAGAEWLMVCRPGNSRMSCRTIDDFRRRSVDHLRPCKQCSPASGLEIDENGHEYRRGRGYCGRSGPFAFFQASIPP